MKKKTLIETNPYLKDPAECEARIILNVASSSAVEGVSPLAFNRFASVMKDQGALAEAESIMLQGGDHD
ncbi:MAG: hypothetical protein WCO89_09240 [Syntrophus sp. (in: bacteria)]